jgi:hypothetical protein
MTNTAKWLLLLCLLSIVKIINSNLFGQEVPQSINNTGIYDFLDELANDQIISVNSAVKPFSRLFIAQRLKEADEKKDQLNSRQQKELDFYLRDFGKEIKTGNEWKRRKDLLYYNDDHFSLTVNPILGGEVFNNSHGMATYWRNGAEARAYINKWGFYASLRDNHEKPLLGLPGYLTRREGGHLKGSADWSEMQGGVTFSWKWGNAGLAKDKLQWGNNYNGANIFGGNNPTYVQLRLHINPVKWFDFNYFHGWLNSLVIDSTRSYYVSNSYGTDYREVYHKKFIAANMFTFTPFKKLNFSAGNSIVYSDLDLFPAYLIPVFFYKSVDHSVNSGIDNMNSQMFFDISSRQIKYLHLYSTLFIDELSINRIFKKDEWNFLSYKAGFRFSNLPVPNLSLTTEFTYSYPLVFQHYVTTLTFESNGYNIGHYLKDNSREWYVALDYRPARTLIINLSFTDAIRGPDYTELGGSRVGNPPLATIQWHNTSYGLKASYQVINDLSTWFSFTSGNITGEHRWSPEYFYGRKSTFNLGMTLGF